MPSIASIIDHWFYPILLYPFTALTEIILNWKRRNKFEIAAYALASTLGFLGYLGIFVGMVEFGFTGLEAGFDYQPSNLLHWSLGTYILGYAGLKLGDVVQMFLLILTGKWRDDEM